MFSCSNTSDDLKLIPVKVGERWQYVDKEGKIVINPQFGYATLFHEDLALVRTEGEKPLYGYIDKEGKFVINANYISASIFSEGLACVTPENGSPTYIDQKGQIKFTLKDALEAYVFTEGFALFSVLKDGEKLYGYVDNTGGIKITPQFKDCSVFADGLAGVENAEGKWGYIDTKGTLVVPYQFASVGDFLEGKAIVSDGTNAGYIDKTGKYLINPQFEFAMAFSEGMAAVKQNGKWGFIDESGKIQINPQFEKVLPFYNGLAPVKSNDKYGYIDKKGTYIISPQFDDASNFYGDVAFITANNKLGLIDKSGKYILNPQFDAINPEIYMNKAIFAGLFDSPLDYDQDKLIETDYFDMASIPSILLPNISGGVVNSLTSNTTLKDVIQKYSIKNETLPINEYSQSIAFTRSMGKYISFDYNFSFADKVSQPIKDLTSNKTSYKPVDATLFKTIETTINLKGKAQEKTTEIIELIKKRLTENGFIVVAEDNNGRLFSSNNDTYGVVVFVIGNSIKAIYPKTQEEINRTKQYYGASTYSEYEDARNEVDF
jgi:hypothetical protein